MPAAPMPKKDWLRQTAERQAKAIFLVFLDRSHAVYP